MLKIGFKEGIQDSSSCFKRRCTEEKYPSMILGIGGIYCDGESPLSAGYNWHENRILIVKQKRLITTTMFLLHELGHWLLFKITDATPIHARYDEWTQRLFWWMKI